MRIDGVIGATVERTTAAGGRLLRVLERYRALVSGKTLEHARPTSIRGDVLYLTVSDPVWKSELLYFTPTFLEAFNEVLPEGQRLREIRIRVGTLPAPTAASPTAAEDGPPPSPDAIPREIRKRIERVEDPALRELMVRVAMRTDEKGNQSG